MAKTQINVWLPSADGMEAETARQAANILNDKDIDFGLKVVGQEEEASMKLVYLSEDLKNVPIMLIKLNTFNMKKQAQFINEIFSKFAYQFRKEPLKSLISYPNKQYFIPNNIEGELVDVKYLNAAEHSIEECSNITKEIKKCMDEILMNPSKFHDSLYGELHAEDKNLGLEMKQADETYRLLYKTEPVTEWRKFNNSMDWDNFVEDLHKEYKTNVINDK